VKCFTGGQSGGEGGKRKSHAASFSYLLIFASNYDIVSHRLGIRTIQIMTFTFEVSKHSVAEDVNRQSSETTDFHISLDCYLSSNETLITYLNLNIMVV
jgi:hypothetical protein